MADYHLQFSCLFDVGSAENAAAAIAIRGQLGHDLERDEGTAVGFDLAIEAASGPGVLWISSDEYGEPEHVITFVNACAEAFDMQGAWGFTWSLSCSKPRLDAHGGGAQVIDLGKRESLAWVDCAHWVADQLAAAEPPRQPGAPA